MNNKGFAISTVIYGLSIMGILLVLLLMSVMSSNRSNSTQLVKSIEEELNRFSKTKTAFEPKFAGNFPMAQSYTVPVGETGWYRIELWGAQGKSNGGKGAYTSGIIKLYSNNTLIFYVGKDGQETDVRIIRGSYDEERSYATRIMVAAGGGSNPTAHGGTIYGYNATLTPSGGTPTTQTLLGYPTAAIATTMWKFGLAPNAKTTAQGAMVALKNTNAADGYVPSTDATFGGSSFISGYGGSNAYVKKVFTGQPVYTHFNEEFNEEANVWQYKGTGTTYFFRDAIMLPGVNAGVGKAKIERIIEGDVDFPIKNSKLQNVRYIRDCVTGGAPTQIYAVTVDGIGLAPTVQNVPNPAHCKFVDLGSARNLSEISVFHDTKNRDYTGHQILVSADNSNWTYLKNSATNSKSVTESITGTHISSYQIDSTTALPNSGNYYILPVLSENEVLTSPGAGATVDTPITLTPMASLNAQKWSIENRGTGYSITELSNNRSLNITGNKIHASQTFENNHPLWNITAVGDGTYLIAPSSGGGFLYVPGAGTKNVTLNTNQVFSRFRLIYIN